MLSHPSRVRGLKYLTGYVSRKELGSHPSRVRGLKWVGRYPWRHDFNVAPFTGAWIEITMERQRHGKSIKSHPSRVRGLKFDSKTPFLSSYVGSHPSRVRGLKYGVLPNFPAITFVAPFTGAWIEIPFLPVSQGTFYGSHPSRVRGLKSCRCHHIVDAALSLTLHGCVD